MKRAKINKIIKFSNVDGPGNRMSIFFQGCNYNCLYCHNPETINRCNSCGVCVESCPAGALSMAAGSKVCWDKKTCTECGRCTEICMRDSSPKTMDYSVKELLEEIKKVSGFIRGITVSGGEATLNYEFITGLFKEVKKLGLTTFVDTNGSLDLREDICSEFVRMTDKFMVDMKGWGEKTHRDLTGRDNLLVKKNIEFLGSLDKLYEVRTVVVPGLLDNVETVDRVSRLIGEINSKNQLGDIIYKLIKYRPIGVRKEILEGELLKIESPADEVMERLSKLAGENGVEKVIII
ncbi:MULTISPECIES: YjjW family glycine radical enzyme activase [Psychrilyobacter]|uniref:YjjW family glycine radical enzyme activase n=1 Tax=Psychrilyobacter piezotolerans TaxID=2293438 RepID=A0ABX9KGD1_9FUSO|nr:MULTISPECIES: YjjW family glycine radical enzyme activase [Psychrilyobacter]MCS5421993.1 YjjW family glycine radical enzyme activase [Psychrilyobacter sp. S5]NDI77727.1 YjjW family glycine radical enzyme activase [Psychrilyobacter piezotolerans]RDE61425.1 YjjW family glycine radical enzyme activase [Psychrilyobacter sp. S5]REI40946.1 YjjW family glycine radical enzyme activase [Psychrilyobacter piezotolerans]